MQLMDGRRARVRSRRGMCLRALATREGARTWPPRRRMRFGWAVGLWFFVLVLGSRMYWSRLRMAALALILFCPRYDFLSLS